MKKLTLIAAAVALMSTSAMANVSAVTLGFAQGVSSAEEVGRTQGVNLKYHYDLAEIPFGFVGSFTYTAGSDTFQDANFGKVDTKGKYYSVMMGPSVQILDNLSFYGLAGASSAEIKQSFNGGADSGSDLGVAYGVGFKFNPYDRLVIDTHYERSNVNIHGIDADIETITLGVGYSF